MNGNIDDKLKIVTGDPTRVTATGWLVFTPGVPDKVQVWVGVSQGKKDDPKAVYGEGMVDVHRPAAPETEALWQCPIHIENGAGTYKKGAAGAGAVVIDDEVEPYPWGRQVKLQK